VRSRFWRSASSWFGASIAPTCGILLSLTAAGRAIYEELAPQALYFACRLTEILTPADRDAFHRALQQITNRSARLVVEANAQNGARANARDL